MSKSKGRKLTDDDQDMLALQRGDNDAMTNIINRWKKQMYKLHFSLKCMAGSIEFDDFLQEVSLRIWTRAETYRVGNGTFCSWIYCIGRSVIIDSYRQARRNPAKSTLAIDVKDHREWFYDDEATVVAGYVQEYLKQRCGVERGVAMEWLLSGECTTEECADVLGLSCATIRWWRQLLVEEIRNRKEKLIRHSVECV